MRIDAPLVTIALPVYNGSETLEVAVRSILNQTFEDWELIIVDDGSKDHSLELAKSFDDSRIRIVAHQKNMNLPVSLNEAVGLARGRYLARMDQDDIAFPERLAVQVAYLASHPDIDMVATGVVVFANDGSCQGQIPVREVHADICRRPWNGFYFPHPTWMGKIEWFRVNPYAPKAAKAEDQDLLLRTCRFSRFACLPEILLGYRQDGRVFRKMFAARRVFVTSCIGEALRSHQWHALLLLGVIFPFKVVADFLSIYLGCKWFRNRLSAVPPEVLRQWQDLWHAVHPAKDDSSGSV